MAVKITPNPNSYLLFDGMCWPNPDDPSDVEWKLRYSRTTLTPAEALIAASMIHAYRQLVLIDSRTRQARVMAIREASSAPLGVVGSADSPTESGETK
jgi:hypothetical protein